MATAARAVVETLEVRRMLSVVTVNTSADNDTHADSVLTVREAIEFINGTLSYSSLDDGERAQIDLTESLGTNDTIKFNIPGDGQQKIELYSLLPTITKAVTIDGYSQPGSAAATDNTAAILNVRLDGYNIDGGAGNSDGLTIAAKNVTVRGLNLISFSGAAIDLTMNSGNDTIAGNYIGLTTGTNPVSLANGYGVDVIFSSNNTIGGTTAADRNIISGNKYHGVLFDVGSSGNTVEGNYIGTDATGAAALGNLRNGISFSQSKSNTVGGVTAGARNVISGNKQDGIEFSASGDGVAGNVVEGNYVGLNAAGTAALANLYNGVEINSDPNVLGPPTGVTIGGAAAGAGNVISGNSQDGIYIHGKYARNNTVQGNLIGTNAAGTAAVGNLDAGVELDGADSNQIGGVGAGTGNVISGNTSIGLYIKGASNNIVESNFIGVLADGVTAAGNTYDGVRIVSSSVGNAIGGFAAGDGNIIANNTTAGVEVFKLDDDSEGVPVGNTIRLNSIYNNGGLGIDLSHGLDAKTTGVTPNDPGDGDTGANDLQNFPILTDATATANSITIGGQLNSTPNTNFVIDFYGTNVNDDSGNGEGKQYLGTLVIDTPASGTVVFSTTLTASIGANVYISATATANSGTGAGDTSEFAQTIKAAVTITPPPPPVAPSVSIGDVKLNEGNTGTAPFTFTLTRTGDLTSASTVSVSTTDGTATAGSDYTALNGQTVSFDANQATATVTVNVAGDTAVESDETFNVIVSAVTNATIGDGSGLGTIVNDDTATPPPAAPSVSINDISQNEGNAGTTAFTFTLTRTGDLTSASIVSVSTADGSATAGSDYTALNGATVAFAANQATATVTVNVTGDTAVETDETFTANVTAVTNATIGDGQGLGTILNDDVVTPPVIVAAPTKLTGKATSPSTVQLKWIDQASNETGFEVQYSTTSDFSSPTTVAVPGANINSAIISGLSAKTTYYFRVRAIDGTIADSDYSNTAIVTTKKVVVPTPKPVITGYQLIDSDTKQVILTITDGMTIKRSSFPTLKHFTVQAIVSGPVESVQFTYKGKKSVQNISPYSLFGDHGVGNYNGESFANGSYVISATAFSKDGAKGTASAAVTIHFKVVS